MRTSRVLSILGSLLASLLAIPTLHAQEGQGPLLAAQAAASPPIFERSVKHDLSPALWHTPPIPPTIRPQAMQIRRPRMPRGRGPRPLIVQDPLIQASPGAEAMPSTSQNFEGVGNNDSVLPPDPNGAVGPSHYVQWVNLSFAVFSKSGDLLYGPAASNTL